ncbi:outer membrane protein with beta-barrel domain [Mariniflexile fucanivorans]|uniref:Outer membrane protein with beta-barrel domain n=1 Tax=Mariniflexile fucanivorans TaxID=264023 RepID=A0A4V2QCX6_9FLAO|nr:outer membrane beta-barrel protein [Mariniflexile fucanivorans]TCL62137.1 outer membrane protein with beta-barrel domain [Mariniflexile fucanivorans]
MKHLKSKLNASKKTALLVLFLVSTLSYTYAQSGTGFGLKGGLNYNANGNYFESIGDNVQHPDRNVGYHVGVFGKIGNQIYFRPELVYTSTKSDYTDDTFEMQKLDAPLLVGVKVLGPLSVFGGPSIQYILDSEFGGININDVKDEFSIGLNFGIGLNFNKVGIDLRYERGFSKNEAKFINSNISEKDRLDTRPEQLILSLSLLL